MSILIKGMEMPNHCGECGIEWCERWKRLIVAGMPSAKARPEDCPLVPVPPHGDLIDRREAIIDAIRASLGDEDFASYCKGNIMKYIWRYRHKNGLEDLKKARVYLNWMIEAEEGT